VLAVQRLPIHQLNRARLHLVVLVIFHLALLLWTALEALHLEVKFQIWLGKIVLVLPTMPQAIIHLLQLLRDKWRLSKLQTTMFRPWVDALRIHQYLAFLAIMWPLILPKHLVVAVLPTGESRVPLLASHPWSAPHVQLHQPVQALLQVYPTQDHLDRLFLGSHYRGLACLFKLALVSQDQVCQPNLVRIL